jgi:2-isopropylmalate synthase
MKVLGTLPDLFTVRTWRVFDESDESGKRYVQASISLAINDAIITSRAEGEGPVDALTRAMRHELDKWYPKLQRMRLGRFSVTAIDVSAHDSAARVRVTVSFTADGQDGHTTESWTTAGVSSDMNQAALNAILDGFHYWLLKSGSQPPEVQPPQVEAMQTS